MKNKIKKVFAVAASAALVGTTLVGALAYDLSDYPAPFVEDGVFNGAIVVGANAATSDVLGAIDIAASLQAEAKTGIASDAGVISVEGGEDFALALSVPSSQGPFDDGDLEGFVDTDASMGGTDYDYSDALAIGTGIMVTTSLNTTYAEEDDYGTDAWMELTKGEIKYTLTFDDPIPLSTADGDDKLGDEEIEVKFLGKTLSIQDADAADNSVTVKTSSEYYLEEGDKVTVDGHEVTLKRIGATSVLVDVDGQTLAITNNGDEEFDQADDFAVEVKSSFYIENAEDNAATLVLGSSLTDTYKDAKALEIFDGVDDADEATWIWDINVNTTHLVSIGAELNIDFDRNNDDNDAEKRAGIEMGGALALPNDYASISFAGWEDSSMAKYDTLEMENVFMDLDVDGSDTIEVAEEDLEVVKFTSSAEKPFLVGTVDTDEVYVWGNSSSGLQIWYDDDGDEVMHATAADFDLVLDADVVTVTPYEDGTEWTIEMGTTPVETFGLGFAAATAKGFTDGITGAAGDEDSADADDFTIDGVDFGTNDRDLKTAYGVYFSNMDSMMDDEELVLNIPHDGQEAKIVITSEGSTVAAAEGGMSYIVNSIALGLGVLDTDANVGSTPMIIVGGPVVNTAAAEVMGNPTPEVIGETFSEGKALIKWYDDNQAMLVAGWDKQETLGAAYVVSKYADYAFAGEELEVVVTSLDDIEVNAVN